MTDITDKDRRQLREDAKAVINKTAMRSSAAVSIAQYILATVDASAPTLAEELRDVADSYGMSSRAADRVNDIADRVEHDLAEARAEVERERDLGVAVGHERDEVSEALAVERRRVEKIAAERDEARAEVERLTAERNRIASGRYITYAEVDGKPVQKGAESNAETPDPADVKPGEPWLIRVRGREAVAIRDGHEEWPWSVAFIHGETDDTKDDVVTLVSRLVPAPRVITNTDELEEQFHGTIIRDARGVVCSRDGMGNAWTSFTSLADQRSLIILPVTVLWEPEA